MPILEDLYDALMAQEEKEGRHVATALEIYVKGSLNLFNHRTNVDIQNRLVCYDIKELGKQLKKIGMLVVQDQVWGRVTANRSAGKTTRYYMDEFHLLLKEEQTAAYSVEIWKRFRKWGGIPTGITQNVKDLLSSREVENIFENSDFVYTHGLKNFEELNELVADKIKQRDEMLAAVQASEKRLAEISVLKTHIINYSKTRATYEEYRKSGYSKKFLEAHREEITLHRAAKAAFDELGVKKLPKVKDLSAEYAQVLARKKKEYAAFRQVRDEMQELLVAQKNIESLYAACDDQTAETKRQTQQEH